jgi:flagellar basal-body rod protein FlgG
MHPALYISETGVRALDQKQAVIANNLANVNTNGFKKDRIMFADLLYVENRQPGGLSSQTTNLPSGLMIGAGVRAVSTQKSHTSGSLSVTQQPLDLAINGRGFFQITLPDGSSAYTRNGQFQINANGVLVNSEGYEVQPNITIPNGSKSITIAKDGAVSVVDSTGTQVSIGQMQAVDFINPVGLQPIGDNLFLETVSSGAPVNSTPGLNGTGFMQQGALESSNVNIVEEMVDMITTQRAFEVNSKGIETSDQMLSYITQHL